MGEIKRGDIWLVNLDPTIGHEIKKARPGIIIQNDLGNRYSPMTIIAPVTSQKLENIYHFEVLMTRRTSGLKKDSKALLNHLRAIDKTRLIRKLGRLERETLEQVDEAIKVSLGLLKL